MENTYHNYNLLHIVIKWWRLLFLLVILSLIISSIASSPLFIKPKYKSVAFLYPVNLSKYSGELECEQMLQILESTDIINNMIRSFNLAKHYQIDTANSHFLSIIYEEFSDNVSFSKTEYSSVKLQVMDTDPKVACAMVDSLILYYNLKVTQLHRTKILEVLKGKKITMDNKKREIDTLEKYTNELRQKFGILDYSTQVERLTEGYIKVLSDSKANKQALVEIKSQLGVLEQRGGDYLSLNSLLLSAKTAYLSAKIEYELLQQEYDKKITYAQVITSPFPADKKAYPVRWLIVLLSVLVSLFFTLLTIGIIENKEKLLQI